jgi:phosphoribosylformimino-5-aminoimidazole carboxamide ribotide isomerase
MTIFRACIDLHQGQVKQIVGGTLGENTVTNYTSSQPASFYANLYKQHNLEGAHVIQLGPGNEHACLSAIQEYSKLQVGGGITLENAQYWIAQGAEKVIVTSYLFPNARFDKERLRKLVELIGKERLVIDLSCRARENEWVVAMNKWQTLTDVTLSKQTFDFLSDYCSEFLIHAADVEGLCNGIDERLVQSITL